MRPAQGSGRARTGQLLWCPGAQGNPVWPAAGACACPAVTAKGSLRNYRGLLCPKHAGGPLWGLHALSRCPSPNRMACPWSLFSSEQWGRAVGAGGVPVHHHFGHFDGPKCSAARARRSPPKSLPRQALLPSITYGTDPVVINIGGLKADLNSAACTRALGLEPRVITSFSPVPLKASHLEACKRNSVRHHRGSIAVSEEH
jgi:hypothetical protein